MTNLPPTGGVAGGREELFEAGGGPQRFEGGEHRTNSIYPPSLGTGPVGRTDGGAAPALDYFKCLDTSLVIWNMLTLPLPPNTFFNFASALIIRRFSLSWSLCLLI